MAENALLTDSLEPTIETYAIATIIGIKLCESYDRQQDDSYGIAYRRVMPTNPYGLDDNSHTVISNVIPALIRPFHEAKIRKLPLVTISGIRKGKESVAFVDNMTDACVFVRNGGVGNYQKPNTPMLSHINLEAQVAIKAFN